VGSGWDGVAPLYDAAMAPLERLWLTSVRAWLCAHATGDVLEVGIGTGSNLPHYPPGVRLTGLDTSRAMLARAHAHAARLGRPVTLRPAAGHLLDDDDASYDTVVATLLLCSVPDEGAAVGELARVLRPGGRLLLADHVVSSSAPLRGVQRVADLATGWTGERWRRRPLDHLAAHGLVVEHVRAARHRLVEAVVARKA
jgi:SAM-dependent methyltransferase